MKKILFLINILFVCFYASAANDVTVTATASVSPPGNNGSLLVEIDPSNSPPFIITITGPSGFNINQTIFSNVYTQGNLAPGIYCVKLVNQYGCETTVCAEVIKCYITSNTYLCSVISEGCCIDALFVTGNPNGYNANHLPSGYNFEVHHSLSTNNFDGIVGLLTSKSIETSNLIAQTGSSSFDIETQNEIESDAMFIYKFSPEGDLIWAYHNYTGDRKSRSLSKTVNTQIEIFPNPVSGDINLLFQKETFSSVSIMDMNGKQLSLQSIDVNATTMQLDGRELPPGVYYLHFVSPGNTSVFKKFIKHNGP